jgi:hypothetical protein
MTTRRDRERGRTAGTLVAFLALCILLAWLAVNGTAFLPVSPHRPGPTDAPRPQVTTR